MSLLLSFLGCSLLPVLTVAFLAEPFESGWSFEVSTVLAANAGAAVATNIMAATRAVTINKLMRLITLFILS